MIKLISQVIADFANGEISQAASLFDTDITLQQYMDKSFYKTATLIAASCKSSAVFSGVSEEVCCYAVCLCSMTQQLGLVLCLLPFGATLLLTECSSAGEERNVRVWPPPGPCVPGSRRYSGLHADVAAARQAAGTRWLVSSLHVLRLCCNCSRNGQGGCRLRVHAGIGRDRI